MEDKGRETLVSFKQIGEDLYKTDQYFIWTETIGQLLHITVARRDGKPVESWYDLWNIKNQIAGDDALGIEVYPPREDLIDGENQRHIFVLPLSLTKGKRFKEFGSIAQVLNLHDTTTSERFNQMKNLIREIIHVLEKGYHREITYAQAAKLLVNLLVNTASDYDLDFDWETTVTLGADELEYLSPTEEVNVRIKIEVGVINGVSVYIPGRVNFNVGSTKWASDKQAWETAYYAIRKAYKQNWEEKGNPNE